MSRLLRFLLVFAVVVLVAGYAADRIAAHAAAGRIATAVQTDAHLAHRPHVTVKGFPFLTQVAKGRYGHIAVKADDVFDLGEPVGTVLRLDFAGVQIPAGQALHGNVHRIPVQTVTGTVTLPFADLQAAAHVPGLSITGAVPGRTDEVALTEVVQVAGASVTAHLKATVQVQGSSIVVAARDLTMAGGTPVPAAVSKAVLAKASFSVTMPGLPRGVRVTTVSVTATGLSAAVRASNLVLTR
jgi:hypothetical protein